MVFSLFLGITCLVMTPCPAPALHPELPLWAPAHRVDGRVQWWERSGTTNSSNDKQPGQQTMITTNHWDHKWQTAGNRNDEWWETTKNGERWTWGMMNAGNDEQRGTGMTNGVAASGSIPPSLQTSVWKFSPQDRRPNQTEPWSMLQFGPFVWKGE